MQLTRKQPYLKGEKKMENILVVIRDEVRENRKVLEEIRDILRDRQGRGVREMHKPAPKAVDNNGQLR